MGDSGGNPHMRALVVTELKCIFWCRIYKSFNGADIPLFVVGDKLLLPAKRQAKRVSSALTPGWFYPVRHTT
jgi:hypothetical protein